MAKPSIGSKKSVTNSIRVDEDFSSIPIASLYDVQRRKLMASAKSPCPNRIAVNYNPYHPDRRGFDRSSCRVYSPSCGARSVQMPNRPETSNLLEELLMEIVSVGPEWAQKLVCGSCRSTLKVAQSDLGWYKKTTWDRGHLGFRCGHCKTVIL